MIHDMVKITYVYNKNQILVNFLMIAMTLTSLLWLKI